MWGNTSTDRLGFIFWKNSSNTLLRVSRGWMYSFSFFSPGAEIPNISEHINNQYAHKALQSTASCELWGRLLWASSCVRHVGDHIHQQHRQYRTRDADIKFLPIDLLWSHYSLQAPHRKKIFAPHAMELRPEEIPCVQIRSDEINWDVIEWSIHTSTSGRTCVDILGNRIVMSKRGLSFFHAAANEAW